MSPDLENRFKFHPANTQEKQDTHAKLRAACREFAEFMYQNLPDGKRETAVVFTKIEEAMYWGNAAIARHGESNENKDA